MDDIGEQLADWGKVIRLQTRGRTSGRRVEVALGYVEEPDGAVLVAAGGDAAWARNLDADPRCRMRLGEDAWVDAVADPLEAADQARAVRELILKYGTPAERLGRGPAFRLRPIDL